MKKGQRSLFDDGPSIGGDPYPRDKNPVFDDPFASFVGKGMAAQKAVDKIIKRKKQPPAYIPPMQPGPGGKQIIYGTIPSKSNCYVIITMKPKKDVAPKYVECDSCKGTGWVVIDGRVKC